MKYWTTLLMSMVLISSSCNKEEEPECLAPDLIRNTNGLQEIACTVNGKYWEAYAPFYLPGSIEGGYNQERNWFGFRANLRIYGNDFENPCFDKRDSLFQYISIGCRVSLSQKCQILSHDKNFVDNEGHCIKAGISRGYQIDTTQPHYIEFIHLDTSSTGSRWAIGTFEFDAINHKCNDTVRVRDGKFEKLK